MIRVTCAILVVLSFIAFVIGRATYGIMFEQDCGGYLKRAADANTVTLARQELDRALEYIERNDITSGYTSVLYRTPDEDVGFWYSNLKASQNELASITDSSSSLERSNVLMKLRETLTDNSDQGTRITIPSGISVFPNNTRWAIWGIISSLTVPVFIVVAMLAL